MRAPWLLVLVIAAVAMSASAFQGNGSSSGQEVSVPDSTELVLELKHTIDVKKANVGDPVSVKLREDVKDSHGKVLIPKKATLAGRVNFLEVNRDDKSATLSFELTEASWDDKHAKLNGEVTRCYQPGPPEPMMQVRTTDTVQYGSSGTPEYGRTVNLSPGGRGSFLLVPCGTVLDGKLYVLPRVTSLLEGSTLHFVQGDPLGRAARLDHPSKAEELFQIGVTYQQRIRPDYGAAGIYYRQAAELGNAKAQNALGWLYGEGKGVHKDSVTAYMWFDIAAQSAPEINNRNLRILEKRMSAEDVAEAKRRAAEWRNAHSMTAP